MIGCSSAVLIYQGWIDPLTHDQSPDRFSTLAVALWWSLGSVALFVRGKQKLESLSSLGSAILAPAAAILAIPVFHLSNPFVWCQVAAIVSAVWFAAAYWLMNREQTAAAQRAIDLTQGLVMVMGVGSAVLAVMYIIFEIDTLQPTLSFPGAVIALIAIALWCLVGLRASRDSSEMPTRLPWIIGLAILAGQIGWLASEVGLVSGVQVIELIAVIWLVTSIASLFLIEKNPLLAYHIAAVSGLLLIVDAVAGSRSDLTTWLAIAGLSSSGCLVAIAGQSSGGSLRRNLALRGLGWFVMIAGSYLLVTGIGLPRDLRTDWTITLGWIALWVTAWRVLAPDWIIDRRPESTGLRLSGLPDQEWAFVLLMMACLEVLITTFSIDDTFPRLSESPLLLARALSLMVVAAATVTRAGRRVVWTAALGTFVAVVSIVSVRVAIDYGATPGQRIASALLPAGFLIALLSHWVSPLSGAIARATVGSKARIGHRLISATWQVAFAIAALAGFSAAMMITSAAPPAEIQMTIVAIALAAWSVAVIADTADLANLRHAAVTLALAAIGFWASVNPVASAHPVLLSSMRWLVASVFAIPTMLFVFPWLIGQTTAQRWRAALQRGAMIAVLAASASLISMLGLETAIRSPSGIDAISLPLVIGVAVTLSILSGLAAVVAILSGPTSAWRQQLNLSDQHRAWLIYAAQAIGAITWLHVFLCKTDWAFIGMRGYWPYIVMGLSFLSVGATEWARRRNDSILTQTLKNTAMYLPLIPVIGFWFGAWSGEFDWLFDRDKVRYDVLLAIGAAYYVAISAIWTGAVPRIAAIVLGNAAWWVVLVQQPGWGFLTHPQAWLIPPAVCVLVAVHRYRDRLESSHASAIRYVATLVIYISSTADMLLQQIGQHISGPIILVLLALAGMAVGVILRVRPFLYLGAMFVFVGVTSMVWHAQAAIGEVWPWWVFGITTGVCLLAGLMALEKNKPKLRRYANELSSWQG